MDKSKLKIKMSNKGLVVYEPERPMTIRLDKEETNDILKKKINFSKYDEICEISHLEISNTCTMDCKYCYVGKKEGKELTVNQWKEIIDKLVDYGIFQCLTGDDTIFIEENGIIQARELKNCNKFHDILAVNKIEKGELFKIPCKEKLYEIKATGGRIIKLTENHQIPTENRGLIRVKNLKIGDQLIINYNSFRPKIINKIDLHKELYNIGIKNRVSNNRIIIERSNTRFNKNIKITKEFATLCGFYVSEGSTGGFSLGPEEMSFAKEIKKCIIESFGINSVKSKIRKVISGINVDSQSRIFPKVFSEILGFGSSARTKRIGKVFNFNEEMKFWFLRGLFLGDGFLRIHKDKRSNLESLSINLKTASKYLAEELRLLLESTLYIYCSIDKGTNQVRQIEGRSLPETEYFSINIYGKENMARLLPYLKGIKNYRKFIKIYNKIGTKKYSIKKFISSKILVKSKKKLKTPKNVYDVTIRNKNHLFTSSGSIIIHNCSFGGGEPTLYDGFIDLAIYAKRKGLNVGMTTNGTTLHKFQGNILKQLFRQINVSWHQDSVLMTDALEYLHDNEIKTGINYCYSRPMAKDNEDLKGRAKHFDAELLYLAYKPVIGDVENVVQPKEIYKVAKKAADEGIKVAVDGPCAGQCMAKKRFCDVNHVGDMFPCSFIRESMGNLLNDSFKNIWKDRGPQIECPFVEINKEEVVNV